MACHVRLVWVAALAERELSTLLYMRVDNKRSVVLIQTHFSYHQVLHTLDKMPTPISTDVDRLWIKSVTVSPNRTPLHGDRCPYVRLTWLHSFSQTGSSKIDRTVLCTVRGASCVIHCKMCFSLIVTPVLALYEYMITLPSEVETVWRKPWTVSSVIFLSNRWIGLLIPPIFGSIPLTPKVGIVQLSFSANANICTDVWLSEDFAAP